MELTCADVRERALEARYLAGSLSDDEAEALEAHYFACDTCWASVRRALEVRAAVAGTTTRPAADSARRAVPVIDLAARARTRRHAAPWWTLAAAAAILIAAVGVWRTRSGVSDESAAAFRGAADSLALRADVRADTLHAVWSRNAEATVYRARVLSDAGDLLVTRDVADTAIAIPLDALPRASGGTLFLDVQAIDALRTVVARAPLARLSTAAPTPSP